MKRLLAGLAFAAVFFVGVSMAEEAAKPQTVKGKVAVTKDKDGKVEKVTIAKFVVAGDKVEDIAKLEGKFVEATGTVETKEGVQTITVTDFKEATKHKKDK